MSSAWNSLFLFVRVGRDWVPFHYGLNWVICTSPYLDMYEYGALVEKQVE
jgi:hypothetical protein